MKRLTDVNWNNVVRNAIREKIEDTGWTNVALAVLINESIRIKPPKGYDSKEVIRSGEAGSDGRPSH